MATFVKLFRVCCPRGDCEGKAKDGNRVLISRCRDEAVARQALQKHFANEHHLSDADAKEAAEAADLTQECWEEEWDEAGWELEKYNQDVKEEAQWTGRKRSARHFYSIPGGGCSAGSGQRRRFDIAQLEAHLIAAHTPAQSETEAGGARDR